MYSLVPRGIYFGSTATIPRPIFSPVALLPDRFPPLEAGLGSYPVALALLDLLLSQSVRRPAAVAVRSIRRRQYQAVQANQAENSDSNGARRSPDRARNGHSRPSFPSVRTSSNQ